MPLSTCFKLLCSFVFAVPFLCISQTWTQLSDFPGVERDDGASFVIGNMAYCGTGITAGFGTWADFYAFDFTSALWSVTAPLPESQVRQYAVGFASGTHGYIFGGTSSGIFFNDLWRYDPVQDTWASMAPMPAGGRSGAMCFVIGNDAYILGGKTPDVQALDEVWVYHMDTDTWEVKSPMPFGARWRAAAAALDDFGYLMFGLDENVDFFNDFHRYDPETDSWTALESYSENGRNYVAMQVADQQLTAFSGFDESGNIYTDLWRYDVLAEAWTELNPLPAPPRRGGMSFSDGNSFYYTTGLDADFQRVKETWKASGLTNVNDQRKENEITLYPNPCKDICKVQPGQGIGPGPINIRICDPAGRTWGGYSGQYSDEIQIDISTLSKGVYLVQLTHDRGVATARMVKY